MVISIIISIVSYNALGEMTRIRWTIGTYYGPEYAPTVAVVAVFPVFVVALYVGFRWLRRYLEKAKEFESVSPYYEFVTLATLGLVVSVQILLVALNLYL